MESKRCNTCNKDKSLSEFHRKSSNPDGYRYRCKECRKSDSRRHYLNNREKIIKYQRAYQKDPSNKEGIRDRARTYKEANRERLNKIAQHRKRVLRETDPAFNLKERVSRQFRRTLTGQIASKKDSMLYPIVCMEGNGLINYLHSTFEENYGLPREYIDLKQVEIDHIIPISTAKTVEEVRKLNHYTNLQLLFKEDNQNKRDKMSKGLTDQPN